MEKYKFNKILILGRHRCDHSDINNTVRSLHSFLCKLNLDVHLEESTGKNISIDSAKCINFSAIDSSFDLIVAVGGDGNLLQAARKSAKYNIPVVGINRGYLGFLTDIPPSSFEKDLLELLQGNYKQEHRALISASTSQNNDTYLALNDVVLLPCNNSSHMIEFTIYANNELICHQRADGLITATPTGSTAYALSGGGPILQPSLDAIVLVPMFPHTLSTRPIVLDSNIKIKIKIDEHMQDTPCFSCDGHERINITPGQSLILEKSTYSLTLLHPAHYNYFATLRNKLGWESKHS